MSYRKPPEQQPTMTALFRAYEHGKEGRSASVAVLVNRPEFGSTGLNSGYQLSRQQTSTQAQRCGHFVVRTGRQRAILLVRTDSPNHETTARTPG